MISRLFLFLVLITVGKTSFGWIASDSSDQRSRAVIIKVQPIRMWSTLGLGAHVGWRTPDQQSSFEVGAYAHFFGGSLFFGVRNYNKKNGFIEISGYYRYKFYDNRKYEFEKTSHLENNFFETRPLMYGGSDCRTTFKGDETKTVLGLTLLLGRQTVREGGSLIEFFWGVNTFYKIRDVDITEMSGRCIPGSPYYYDPPDNQVMTTFMVVPFLGVAMGWELR